MSEKSIINKLDDLLKPIGFTRQKAVWNRRSARLVEVIDLQISKTGEIVTINTGVLDSDVHVKLWKSEPPQFVEEPDCTIRARVGELIDGKDLWWPLSDNQVAEKISKEIIDRVLPFVQRMRSRQDMVQWLTDTQVVKKRYPLPIINLAIIQSSLGETREACSLLAEVQNKAVGAWRTTAAKVAERLGCAED